ncbi:MAG: hydrogenase maturation protease [Thermoplasmata archaeon]|nr:hydrogenase maturation protease [Thermoplasmata archaeon]
MKQAIIGIGNPLMGDDGAGIAVLNKLKGRKSELPEDIDYVEMGTGGINLVHVIADYDRVVIIDAAQFGGQPAEVRKFRPDEVQTLKTQGYSLHDWDLFTSLDISKRMGELPEEIWVISVQMIDASPVDHMTSQVEEAVEEMVGLVIDLFR